VSALIIGVSGQDGAYLGRLLAARGQRVAGTSRSAGVPQRFEALGIGGEIEMHVVNPTDATGVAAVIDAVAPDAIYLLSAQSSVGESFAKPDETRASIVGAMRALIEAKERTRSTTRVVFAASGDCFGETGADAPVTETSPFNPHSPYGEAKCEAHRLVCDARDAGGDYCSAFLFSHESRLRDERFAIGKIVHAAKRIAQGSDETLLLQDVTVVRDWGWAAETVDALAAMAAAPEPRDYVVATGQSFPLALFVERAFARIGRDWRDHVRVDPAAPRPGDIREQHADPAAIRRDLGWRARVTLPDLVDVLM